MPPRGGILLMFLVFPFYEQLKQGKKSENNSDWDGLAETWQDYADGLAPKPDWSCLWNLSPKLFKTCKFELKDKTEFYPGVLFFSRVSKLL